MKILRAFLFVLIAAALVAAQAPPHPGVMRWSIKTSIPAGAEIDHAKSVKLADMLQFPEPPASINVTKNDSRFQSALIPSFPNSLNLKEGDIVRVRGWLHIIAAEDDGDYHIQLSASRSDGNQCLIVEAPRPETDFVTSTDLWPLLEAERSWARDKLLHDVNKEPSSGGNCMDHPPYVEFTGQLFYDDSHVHDQPRGKKGQKAATLWELHPLLKMRFVTRPSPAEPLGDPCPH
jgi:hypothetical protein